MVLRGEEALLAAEKLGREVVIARVLRVPAARARTMLAITSEDERAAMIEDIEFKIEAKEGALAPTRR